MRRRATAAPRGRRAARTRPDRDEYFLGIARATSERANCTGRKVGAILVLNDRVISSGYNGTPESMDNCDQGGCHRCENRGGQFPPGEGYDKCICVHAEQNALLAAARFGIAVECAVLYSTDQPCFGCTKELLQAKIAAVYYEREWGPGPKLIAEYRRLQARFPNGIRRLSSTPAAAGRRTARPGVRRNSRSRRARAVGV